MASVKRVTSDLSIAGTETDVIQVNSHKLTLVAVDKSTTFAGTILVWRRPGASGTWRTVASYTDSDLPVYKDISENSDDAEFKVELDAVTAGNIIVELEAIYRGN